MLSDNEWKGNEIWFIEATISFLEMCEMTKHILGLNKKKLFSGLNDIL